MKTLSLILLMTLTLLSVVSAQTEKGRWTVGAQLGNLTYQDQNGGRSFSGNISPSAGYFITNGLVIGTGIPLSWSTQKSTGDNTYYQYHYSSSAIGLSPFVRYFMGKTKLKPYVGLAYSYSKISLSTTRNDITGPSSSDGKGKITAFVPTLGLAYFISQNLGLTAGLNYNLNHQNQETTSFVTGYSPSSSTYNSDTKSVALTIGFQLFIGQ